MANRTKNTPKKRALFLGALTEGASVTAACNRAVITRRTVYNWWEADPEFAAAWDDAIEAGTDALEDEALRRAKDKSDTLLIFLLKARRPEKYKDRVSTEHRGTVKTFEQWLDELNPAAKQLIDRASDDASQGNGAIMPNSRVSGASDGEKEKNSYTEGRLHGIRA
jgi:Bacteriophage Sf6, terminase small subunit-like